jgi:hypothetical protein
MIGATPCWSKSPAWLPIYDQASAKWYWAEAVTRLADRADPIPDEVYDEAARHYDEQGLAVLILMIATANLFNRLHVTTRQVAGSQSWELLIPGAQAPGGEHHPRKTR